MLLQTNIPARLDGTVIVSDDSGAQVVFQADANGDLVGDVQDEALLVRLLGGGMFYPHDQNDFEAALALTGKASQDEQGTDEDPEDESEENHDALPLEAMTPPAPARKRATSKAQ